MDFNYEKNTVIIFGKSEKLDTLANRLASLSGEQVYGFFSNRGIDVPRKMNCMALTSVINERLKTLHASELSKDYFQRLNYYKEFSEVQLYNLFLSICNTKEQFKQYRVNLFKLIIMNFVGLNLTDGELKYLKDLKKLSVENFDTYFRFISSMCQEQENTFDGQDITLLRDFLVNSGSNQEIMDLGRKYGIQLSQSLKKQELIDYMKYYLNRAGELSKSLEYEIDASTLQGLNNMCIKYRVPMSSNMNKSQLVTYLFYILSQCEIKNTSIRRIEFSEMYKPLEFTVDMSLFKGFYRDDTKRVIHYVGEENDYFPILEPKEEIVVDNPIPLTEPKVVEEKEEPIINEPEEIQQESMEEEKEEPKEEIVEEQEEVVEEPIEEIVEEQEEVVEEPIEKEEMEEPKEEAVEEKEEPLKKQEEPVVEEKEEPKAEKKDNSSFKLAKDDVSENPNYHNEKTQKLGRSKVKIALLISAIVVVVGVAVVFFLLMFI